MQRIYTSDNFLIVGHLRELLQSNHIPCVVRNEFLIGAAGELPPLECWPELWVAEDHQLERARALVDAYLAAGPVTAGDWTCERCGEHLEGQFTECWRCGDSRPASPAL